MTLLNTVNVGGTDFGLLNNTVMGVCSTPAGSEIKTCTFADSFELKAGVVVTIKFTYANTYGDGSTTYPKLSVNGVTGAIRDASGTYASNGCWNNQSLVPLLFDGTDFMLLINNVTDTVALNNMYSVTSNSVAKALKWELIHNGLNDSSYDFTKYRELLIWVFFDLINVATSITIPTTALADFGNIYHIDAWANSGNNGYSRAIISKTGISNIGVVINGTSSSTSQFKIYAR